MSKVLLIFYRQIDKIDEPSILQFPSLIQSFI